MSTRLYPSPCAGPTHRFLKALPHGSLDGDLRILHRLLVALPRARRHGRESFSQVIKRARWDEEKQHCGDLLAKAVGTVSEETLARLEQAQKEDAPPEDKWAE